jgi:hypothetical protein
MSRDQSSAEDEMNSASESPTREDEMPDTDNAVSAFGNGLGLDVDSVTESDEAVGSEQENEFRGNKRSARTDTYSIFPTLKDESSAPVDIPSDQLDPLDEDSGPPEGVQAEEFLEAPRTPANGTAPPSEPETRHRLSMETLVWLEQWTGEPGARVLELSTSQLQGPLEVLIADGRVCFGMEVGGMPFLDVALKRDAPRLVATLVDLYQDRRSEQTDLPLSALVEQRDLALRAHCRNAMMGLLTRTLERVAPVAEADLHVRPVELDEGVELVGFTPLELALLGREPNLDEYESLQSVIPDNLSERALQTWHFAAREEHPFESLRDVSYPGQATVEEAFSAYDICRRLVEAARRIRGGRDREVVAAIGFESQKCWFAAQKGALMSLYRFEPSNTGMIVRAAKYLSETRVEVRANGN